MNDCWAGINNKYTLHTVIPPERATLPISWWSQNLREKKVRGDEFQQSLKEHEVLEKKRDEDWKVVCQEGPV